MRLWMVLALALTAALVAPLRAQIGPPLGLRPLGLPFLGLPVRGLRAAPAPAATPAAPGALVAPLAPSGVLTPPPLPQPGVLALPPAVQPAAAPGTPTPPAAGGAIPGPTEAPITGPYNAVLTGFGAAPILGFPVGDVLGIGAVGAPFAPAEPTVLGLPVLGLPVLGLASNRLPVLAYGILEPPTLLLGMVGAPAGSLAPASPRLEYGVISPQAAQEIVPTTASPATQPYSTYPGDLFGGLLGRFLPGF